MYEVALYAHESASFTKYILQYKAAVEVFNRFEIGETIGIIAHAIHNTLRLMKPVVR